MRWWCPFLLLGLSAAALGQTGPTKGPDGKGKEPIKTAEPGKNPFESLPPGALLVVVDELKDFLALGPRLVFLRADKLTELEEKLKALEKMLKQDRRPAGVCKLSGRLDGDVLALRAEFLFTTGDARVPIFLGLYGGFLTDEGDLDGATPALEAVDDGYIVRVEKAGNHRLVLNLVTAVGHKRGVATTGGAERTIELSLPGAAVTTVSLDLPPSIREIRHGDALERRRVSRFELALGRSKILNLSWKEPVTLPGGAPMIMVESQIDGKVEETHIFWNADITVEDRRGKAKEFQFVLPPGATAELKTPGGELQAVEGKPNTHVLRVLGEATSERWLVHVQGSQPRAKPGARLPMWLFHVSGAHKHKGTITMQAAPDALRGQTLFFHRIGETYQKDTPKAAPGTLAVFQYFSLPTVTKGGKGARAPLDLEWKTTRGKAETHVEHTLRLVRIPDGHLVETTTRIQLKEIHGELFSLDLQLPRWVSFPIESENVFQTLGFPMALPWLTMLREVSGGARARPQEFTLEGSSDVVEWGPPDAEGRAQVVFLKPREPLPTVVLQGRYVVPRGADRCRIDLPRPLGTIDRETKVLVRTEDNVEFVHGLPGSEEPVVEHQRWQRRWEGPVEAIDLAWRPYVPEASATAIVDVHVHDRSAHVHMALHFPSPARLEAVEDPAALVVPKGLSIRRKDLGDGRSTVSFDVDVHGGRSDDDPALLSIVLPRPKRATRMEAKVRVWSEGGTRLLLDASAPDANVWKDRGTEVVDGKDSLPGLVVFGVAAELELPLRVSRPSTSEAPQLFVERALMQAGLDDDGNLTMKARFLVRRFQGRSLGLELPLPPANCMLQVWLGDKLLPWQPDKTAANVARLTVDPALFPQPVMLDVEYLLPAGQWDSGRLGSATLVPPRFVEKVYVSRIRWHIAFPDNRLALAVGQARTQVGIDFVGWLLGPRPRVSAAELEYWMADRAASTADVSLVIDQNELEALTIVHVPRQLWLVFFSALTLLVGLALLFAPNKRWLGWTMAAALVVAVGLALWLGWAWLLAVFYGCQPGFLVLALAAATQWLWRQKYRRQMLFLPGFTRLKPGSTLNRAKALPATHDRQPSTVDAPAPLASGIGRTVGSQAKKE